MNKGNLFVRLLFSAVFHLHLSGEVTKVVLVITRFVGLEIFEPKDCQLIMITIGQDILFLVTHTYCVKYSVRRIQYVFTALIQD